jgi:Phosphate-starvation-inducible E family
MRMQDEFREAGRAWSALTIYGRFEHAIVLVLTVLIAIVVVSATWHLAIGIGPLIFTGAFNPADQAQFQEIFGMIIIVIIALEFEHSLLVVLARQESIIRLRTVIVLPCWPWSGGSSSSMSRRLRPTSYWRLPRQFWRSASFTGWFANKTGATKGREPGNSSLLFCPAPLSLFIVTDMGYLLTEWEDRLAVRFDCASRQTEYKKAKNPAGGNRQLAQPRNAVRRVRMPQIHHAGSGVS